MKKSIWMAIIALSMTLFFVACDDDDDDIQPPTLDQYDINFLSRATQLNRAQIALSQLAADSGTNPAVQQYGLDMVSDHQAAQQQLDSIAAAYSLTLPGTGDTTIAQFRDSLAVMARGRDFDTSYVGFQSRLHERYLVDLNDASTNAKNDRVRNYVGQRLGTVTTFKSRADSLFGSL